MVFLLPSPAIDFATPGRKWCWHTTNSLQMTGDLMLIICWRRESCGPLAEGDWDAFVSRQSEVSERREGRDFSKAGKMISECNVADNRQENEYFIWPELLTRAICMSGGDRHNADEWQLYRLRLRRDITLRYCLLRDARTLTQHHLTLFFITVATLGGVYVYVCTGVCAHIIGWVYGRLRKPRSGFFLTDKSQ